MRDLSLAISQGFSKPKSRSLDQTTRINLLLLFSIIVLSLTYLFAVNSMGTKGYEIKKLQQQLGQLETQQKNLQVQASDLQSINKIQEQAQQLNFVPATNVTYLKASDYALK